MRTVYWKGNVTLNTFSCPLWEFGCLMDKVDVPPLTTAGGLHNVLNPNIKIAHCFTVYSDTLYTRFTH